MCSALPLLLPRGGDMGGPMAMGFMMSDDGMKVL